VNSKVHHSSSSFHHLPKPRPRRERGDDNEISQHSNLELEALGSIDKMHNSYGRDVLLASSSSIQKSARDYAVDGGVGSVGDRAVGGAPNTNNNNTPPRRQKSKSLSFVNVALRREHEDGSPHDVACASLFEQVMSTATAAVARRNGKPADGSAKMQKSHSSSMINVNDERFGKSHRREAKVTKENQSTKLTQEVKRTKQSKQMTHEDQASSSSDNSIMSKSLNDLHSVVVCPVSTKRHDGPSPYVPAKPINKLPTRQSPNSTPKPVISKFKSNSPGKISVAIERGERLQSPPISQQQAQTQSQLPPIQVISLPWINHLGVSGQYTGEVNSLIQPHGKGSLNLGDGTCVRGVWCNGTALDKQSKAIHQNDEGRRNGKKQDGLSRRDRHHRRSQSDSSSKDLHDSSTKSLSKQSKNQLRLNNSSSSLSSMTSLPRYALGDTLRSPDHMDTPLTVQKAIKNADSLQTHDFAFVLRSTGQWCYAIVAKKIIPEGLPTNAKCKKEDIAASILFVLDKQGATKKVKRKHWGKLIRLVNLGHESEYHEYRGEESDDCWYDTEEVTGKKEEVRCLKDSNLKRKSSLERLNRESAVFQSVASDAAVATTKNLTSTSKGTWKLKNSQLTLDLLAEDTEEYHSDAKITSSSFYSIRTMQMNSNGSASKSGRTPTSKLEYTETTVDRPRKHSKAKTRSSAETMEGNELSLDLLKILLDVDDGRHPTADGARKSNSRGSNLSVYSYDTMRNTDSMAEFL